MTGTVVCQISRGEAPAESIAQAVSMAHECDATYYLVARKPAVVAKNETVAVARETGRHLVLVEDDVLIEARDWHTAVHDPGEAIYYCPTWCRNGEWNTRHNGRGELLYTGTVFVRVPYSILCRLPDEPFAAYDYQPVGDDLALIGPNHRNQHSDVHFWQLIRKLDPRPAVVELNPALHIKHSHTTTLHRMDEPPALQFWGGR